MSNKILLAAIALGLWANAAVSYVRPARAQGDAVSYALAGIDGSLSGINSTLKSLLSTYQLRDDCRAR